MARQDVLDEASVVGMLVEVNLGKEHAFGPQELFCGYAEWAPGGAVERDPAFLGQVSVAGGCLHMLAS